MIGGPAGAFYLASALDRGNALAANGEVVVPAAIYNTKNINDFIIVVVNPGDPGSPAWPEFATEKPAWIKYMIWAIGAAMALVGGWIAYREYTGQSLTLGGNEAE